MIPRKGDRIKVTGIMPNDPSPMEIGAEGTVVNVRELASLGFTQIDVDWDSGRGLILLDSDPFTVIGHKMSMTRIPGCCGEFDMLGHYCELPDGHDSEVDWQEREHMNHLPSGTEWRWTYRRKIAEIDKHSSGFD